MALSLFQSDAYRSLMQDHLYNTLAFLLEEGQEFAVALNVEHLKITPDLPGDIQKSFGQTALFVLAGYTFESAYIDDDTLYFEAGFGEENIGAHIQVPLLAIQQIFIGEYPITINVSSPRPFQDTTTPNSDRSMEALLRNPENQKLLKDIK